MKINIFYDGTINGGRAPTEWPQNIQEQSESVRQIEAFSKKILAIFQKNPELTQEAIDQFDAMVEGNIIRDPVRFKKLLDALYSGQQTDLDKLDGAAKEESKRNFSKFVSGIMLQYADINQFYEYGKMIQEKNKSLTENTQTTIKLTQNGLADLKASFA